jgi:hypothetical protein
LTSRFRVIVLTLGGLKLGKSIEAAMVARVRRLYWDMDGGGVVNGAWTMLRKGNNGFMCCWRQGCTGWFIIGEAAAEVCGLCV